ncbi:hypothetical protein ABMA27_010228 [Loxostege sticticalis]|uniref:Uncharacterized protein n=1 Tax=Loxostege sticticalis TaxID=481309 RepID=A0ABR3H521_LOXSC
METLPFGLFFVHTLFFTISESNAYRRDASSKFANLLKNIVSINERRFEAMKELARLQEYSVTKYQLRSGRENFEFEERIRNSKGPLVIFIVERRKLRTIHNKRVHHSSYPLWNEDIEPYRTKTTQKSDSSDEKDSMDLQALSRRSGKSTCKRKYCKDCLKACKRAYKNVCNTFSCEKFVTRKFRLECKITCNQIFNKGKYSDDD